MHMVKELVEKQLDGKRDEGDIVVTLSGEDFTLKELRMGVQIIDIIKSPTSILKFAQKYKEKIEKAGARIEKALAKAEAKAIKLASVAEVDEEEEEGEDQDLLQVFDLDITMIRPGSVLANLLLVRQDMIEMSLGAALISLAISFNEDGQGVADACHIGYRMDKDSQSAVMRRLEGIKAAMTFDQAGSKEEFLQLIVSMREWANVHDRA